MRTPRIKVDAQQEEAVYHCITRVVNGERLLDEVAREVLRRQLWQVADYCGVRIVTHAILSNHFHVLLRVPRKEPVNDAELLRRYAVLYPKPTRYQTARLEVLKANLKEPDNAEARAWRARQLALMGDMSQFMKLVKQRFSVWYNRTHGRYGTLWAERFKSVLLEGRPRVISMVAAYIDLNAVRAGLAGDPKDYRFCGYGEAVAGHEPARTGLAWLFDAASWKQSQGAYRQMLFGRGSGPQRKGAELTPQKLAEVIKAGGELPLAALLHCRVRYFSDGAVLGSRVFVREHLQRYRRLTGRRRTTEPRPLPKIADLDEITALRGLRESAARG